MEEKTCKDCKKNYPKKNLYPFTSYGIREPIYYLCSVCFHKWERGPVKIKAPKTEHVPDSMKEDRKRFAKSMLQPWREGEPSAEFIEAYPKQAKKMFTPKEMMKAKNVWKGEPNYENWRKSE